jgi:peptide/nickel transport system permease protein
VLALLVCLSIYAIIAVPYSEAIRLWRGGPGVWSDNPRNASPLWTDWFSQGALSRTIIADSRSVGTRTSEPLEDGKVRLTLSLPFEFPYDTFPSEVNLFCEAGANGARVSYSVSWVQPDGTVIPVSRNLTMTSSDVYYITQDSRLLMRMPAMVPVRVGLFSGPEVTRDVSTQAPVKGPYQVIVEAQVSEGQDFESKIIIYGQVHGLAGTDNQRRDLTVALLWGAPLAMLFGLVGAVGSSIFTFVLAGIGTWFGGWLDALFQRLTTLNMLIPLLPLLIMIGQFYSRSLWIILGVVIGLSIFSASYLTYRSMFLQAKQAAFIEAGQAYGASNSRIIFRYLLPRIVPVLLPYFVLAIPSFVFLEASLAVIGLGDPILPTWGKLIYEARSADALYKGYYYWVIQPAVMLMITGFGFALVGFALDRIFNPRLRTM